ncbi:MAG: hypothetical protein ASARMPREDX12_001750 [Alectoria sarmentosa]|nr:MAG: hypothetical protein ASARMPREDX12_001750 [Alectoria sarmentosa]
MQSTPTAYFTANRLLALNLILPKQGSQVAPIHATGNAASNLILCPITKSKYKALANKIAPTAMADLGKPLLAKTPAAYYEWVNGTYRKMHCRMMKTQKPNADADKAEDAVSVAECDPTQKEEANLGRGTERIKLAKVVVQESQSHWLFFGFEDEVHIAEISDDGQAVATAID